MLRDELYDAICNLPVIDVHSHMARDHLAARSLNAVVFYHMLTYPLRAAGMSEETLFANRHDRGPERLEKLFDESMPHWDAIERLSFGWGLRTILRELYGFAEPITADSLPRLRQAFERETARAGFAESVRERLNLRRILSSRIEVPPLGEGESDGGIRFTVEENITSGIREFHTWPRRLEEMRDELGSDVTSLAELKQVAADFYGGFDFSDKHALVSWISSEIDFRPVPDPAIDALLADAAAGNEPDRRGARLLEAAMLRAVCEAIRGKTSTLQLCYGTQFLTPGYLHPQCRADAPLASGFGRLLGEFPDLHFNILTGFETDEPIWCSLCQGYANISLGGYWWNTFYPSVMHRAWHRRLETVPTTRLCGFFSDGYCIDWIFARVRTTQRVLANVLAEKIEWGFLSESQAIDAAREVLFETPRRLFLPDEDIEA